MSKQAMLIGFIAAFTVLISCGDQIPTNPTSAGKITVEGEPISYIVWECGADEWMDAADSTWTIFFHGKFRLYIEGTTVEISEYSPTSKLVYEAGDPGRPNFSLYAYGSRCMATTELIGTEIPDIRIWRGDVDWLYRDDPQNSRYVLYENDLVYQIARIGEKDAVGYIDFESIHNRNDPRPMLDEGAKAIWPVNVDQVKRDSLEASGQVPTDDRPYLLDVICQAEECFDLQFSTGETFLSPPEEQDSQGSTRQTVRSVPGEQDPQEPTTNTIFTTKSSVEFVSQEETPEPLVSARSHTTGHRGNTCGTGPMPANSPPNCANGEFGRLGCNYYYRCEEYDGSSDGCARWSGPYGKGGAGMRFCDLDGLEWDNAAAFSDAIVSGDHTTSVELDVYCANLDDWITICEASSPNGFDNNCSIDPRAMRTEVMENITQKCPPGETPNECRDRRYEILGNHCGHLARPEGWTGDWPPAGFTKP